MGMAAILFNGVEPFEQVIKTLLTEGLIWNFVKGENCSSGRCPKYDFSTVSHIMQTAHKNVWEANLTLPLKDQTST